MNKILKFINIICILFVLVACSTNTNYNKKIKGEYIGEVGYETRTYEFFGNGNGQLSAVRYNGYTKQDEIQWVEGFQINHVDGKEYVVFDGVENYYINFSSDYSSFTLIIEEGEKITFRKN